MNLPNMKYDGHIYGGDANHYRNKFCVSLNQVASTEGSCNLIQRSHSFMVLNLTPSYNIMHITTGKRDHARELLTGPKVGWRMGSVGFVGGICLSMRHRGLHTCYSSWPGPK